MKWCSYYRIFGAAREIRTPDPIITKTGLGSIGGRKEPYSSGSYLDSLTFKPY